MLLNFLIIPSNKQGIPRSSRSRNMKRTTLGGTVIPVTESTRPVHCMAVCWYRTAGTQVGGTPQYPQGSPQEPCEGVLVFCNRENCTPYGLPVAHLSGEVLVHLTPGRDKAPKLGTVLMHCT